MVCKCLAAYFHLLQFLRKIFYLIVFAAHFCLMFFDCVFVKFCKLLIKLKDKIFFEKKTFIILIFFNFISKLKKGVYFQFLSKKIAKVKNFKILAK